ncbi:MAG: hypothetical protein DRP57_11335 [Spirochaetes bacterium]|nr:MAG: hypothetical protein DRP57_11335 [Spirochaetota bacterium]
MRDKDMTNIAQILEEELSEAFEVRNEKALKRYVSLLLESLMEKEKAENEFHELKSDLKIIAETMKEGFRLMEKRFEQIDRRFEQVDKRFEDMYHYMDKRFEQVDKRFEQVDKRFEQVDKRFEDMYHYMDKRFGDLNKRIGFMSWFTPTIVTVLITLVMVAMKFL